jgi:hypothetical protein
MKSDTHLAAFIAIMTWSQVMLGDMFGLFGTSTVVMSLLGMLYATSCLGLHLVRRSGRPMPWIIPWGGPLVLAWCLFVLYGALLDNVQLQNLVEAPSRTGLALLFVNGPLVALAASAILAYPLAVLYGRHAAAMSVVIALPIFGISLDMLSSSSATGFGFVISALDSVWFYVALRTVPAWAFRRMAVR